MTLAKCAPYHGSLTQTYQAASGDVLQADSLGLYFLSAGHATRFSQAGILKQVQFYAANTNPVTDFNILIWRKNEATGLYNRIYTSPNLRSKLALGLNIIDLSSYSITVAEGDSFGVYLKGAKANYPVLAVAPSTHDYQANVRYARAISDSNFNWFASPATAGFNASISMEFYMDSPDMVWIGDSICSGHNITHACTDQGDSNNFIYPAKSIEYKFKTLTGLTYQNMGISGDKFPGLSDRLNADAISKNPRFIVLEGGVNSITDGIAPAAVATYIENEIVAVQAAGIIPILILVLPNYGYTSSSVSLKMDQLNALLITYHTTNPNFILVDARDALGYYNASNGWALDPANTIDNIHLSETGNGVLAQTIANAFTAPTANFSAINDNAFKNIVHFTNSSTGYPYSYSWNFGDGTTSTAENPSHTYTTSGTFTVSLTVTNYAGTSIKTANVVSCGKIITFDGLFIGVYNSGKAGFDIDIDSVQLQSGKKYVAIGPDPQMSNKSFECYANSFAEIVTISEKIGTFGTLTINGVDYPNRYISGLDNIFEIWEGTDHWTFSIQFDRADVY